MIENSEPYLYFSIVINKLILLHKKAKNKTNEISSWSDFSH